MGLCNVRNNLLRADSPSLWGVVVFCCLCASALLASKWEERLMIAADGVLLRGANYGTRPRSAPSAGTFQRIEEHGGTYSAEYGFVNYNNDPLRVGFSVSSRELASYMHGYGYAESELEALKQWQKKSLDDAYNHVVKNRLKQEDLNRMADGIKAEYRRKFRELFASRGFALLPGNVVVADIPGIARRNVKNVRPVALDLGNAAEKHGYDSDEIISAALSLVQTAIKYENVPGEIKGRQTGGIYPPVEALVKGKGDCDTKTALLGAILLNWDKVKLVGVGVPNHYLMGILRHPAKGEAFIEYRGMRYVLLEPAGPAWLPPGSVGPTTTALLNSGKGINIEPFAAQ